MLPDQYLKVCLGVGCLLLTALSQWALCIWLITFIVLQGAARKSSHVWYFCNESSKGGIIILVKQWFFMEFSGRNWIDMIVTGGREENPCPGCVYLSGCVLQNIEGWRAGTNKSACSHIPSPWIWLPWGWPYVIGSDSFPSESSGAALLLEWIPAQSKRSASNYAHSSSLWGFPFGHAWLSQLVIIRLLGFT